MFFILMMTVFILTQFGASKGKDNGLDQENAYSWHLGGGTYLHTYNKFNHNAQSYELHGDIELNQQYWSNDYLNEYGICFQIPTSEIQWDCIRIRFDVIVDN